jgi:hypothetical protein
MAESSGANVGGVVAKIDGGGGGDWMAILIAWLREENGPAKTLVSPGLTQLAAAGDQHAAFVSRVLEPLLSSNCAEASIGPSMYASGNSGVTFGRRFSKPSPKESKGKSPILELKPENQDDWASSPFGPTNFP